MSDYQLNENDSNHRDTGLEQSGDEPQPEMIATEPTLENFGLFELIYGTLFNPVETFTKISCNPPLFLGFIIFVISVTLTSVTRILLPQDIADMPSEVSGILSQAGPSVAILGAIVTLVFWFIQAGILQVIAELLGGRGRAAGVLTILALAGIPSVIVIPFQVAGYFFSASFLGRFFALAGNLLSFVWWFVILILGLRQVHSFSTGKAVISIVAPVLVFLLVIIVIVITMFAFIAPLLNSIQ